MSSENAQTTNDTSDTSDSTENERRGDRLVSDDLEREAAARGGVYALLATLFDEPNEATYDRLASGFVDATCRELVEASALRVTPPDLTVDEPHDLLCARFNDLFTVGYAEYTDRTDGSLDAEGPPVSLYESAYRPEASWNDVNLDLARAYDYFGLGVDQSARDNHDFLPYLLEFVGYLARQEAAGSEEAARARLDFHDRHLHVLSGGLADAMAEQSGTSIYGELAAFLDRFVAADQRALAARFEEADNRGQDFDGDGTGEGANG
jgi:DMSO reductase family type II enzyme chaperone